MASVPLASVALGIDSSTQSTKIEARSIETGQIVAVGTAPHPPTTPPQSEQDPTSWWQALVAACASLPAEVRERVATVSVAGQQHGLVLLDAAADPVRPAKLWNDTTSAPEASALVHALGADPWAAAVGSLPVAAFTISKLAWVAAHEPQLLDRVAKVCLPHDYLTFRLCGEHVTDRGDASGTGWFDPTTNEYRSDLLSLAGVNGATWVERLPTVLAPDQVAGLITAEAAAELGLADNVIVGPGSGDNMGSALGLGLQPGDVVMSLGTSGVAYARSTTPTQDPSGAVAGFADATGGYLPLVCTLNATKVTDTVAGWLGTDPAGLGELALAAAPTAATVVPWFDGERTPNRPNSSGTMFGLRTDTTREQIALAAHDGVLCGLFNGIDALGACGVDTSGTLHLIGGGARSLAYRQRCADLWGRPIALPHSEETVATGAAAQAASILDGQDFDAVRKRWNLGASDMVEPNTDIERLTIRDRYRAAIEEPKAAES